MLVLVLEQSGSKCPDVRKAAVKWTSVHMLMAGTSLDCLLLLDWPFHYHVGKKPDSGNVSCMINQGRRRATVDPWNSPPSTCSGRESEVSWHILQGVGDWPKVRTSWPLHRDCQWTAKAKVRGLMLAWSEECTHTDCQLPSRATTAYLGLVKGNGSPPAIGISDGST